jgi:hypothetical protein
MHQPNDVQFTTMRLSTGLRRVHYAEQVNPTGEAIVFLHAYVELVVLLQPGAPLALS